jgi:hypothetical protein
MKNEMMRETSSLLLSTKRKTEKMNGCAQRVSAFTHSPALILLSEKCAQTSECMILLSEKCAQTSERIHSLAGDRKENRKGSRKVVRSCAHYFSVNRRIEKKSEKKSEKPIENAINTKCCAPTSE